MSIPPNVWDEWIGPSPSRTLLAMECRESEDAKKQPPRDTNRLKAKWPSDEEQHLYAYPIGQMAGVVWLAGRAFLVGTPEGVVQILNGIDASHEGGTTKNGQHFPDNVILLSWSEAHIAGFKEYVEAWQSKKAKKNKLIIWTSDWIWEHVLDKFFPKDTSVSLLEFKTFDIEHLEHFAARTTVSMAYTVGGKSPELYAHFCLFDSHLLVGLDRAKPDCAPPLGLPDVATYQKRVSKIYYRHPRSRELLASMLQRRIKQLSDASILAPLSCARRGWWYRFSLSAGTLERVLRPNCEQNNGNGRELCEVCKFPPEFITDGNTFAQEVSLRSISGEFTAKDLPASDNTDACNQWNKENFKIFYNCPIIPAAAAAPDEAQPYNCTESKPISLVIGCGAPPTRWNGNINPNRYIVLGEHDVSVLEAKLLQYIVLRLDPEDPDKDSSKMHSVFSDHVYTLVAPATETAVREELARIWREHEDKLANVKYHILRNRVAPRYERSEAGGLRYFRQSDGEFQYNPAGHLDLLWLLNNEAPEGLFYFTNLTNMGINVTEKVAILRSHMMAAHADAVFELVQHEEHACGMGAGSYWIAANDSNNALIKPIYCGEEQEGRGWQNDRNKVVSVNTQLPTYMSTGSVLINTTATRIHQKKLNELPWFARHRRPLRTPGLTPADETNWSVQLERDLDQITWVKDVKCSGVVLSSKNDRRRFFAAKKETDLYEKSYTELKTLYQDLPFFKVRAASPTPPPCAPLALVPAEQHDPWGNDLLRFVKGLPQSDVQISETWESSAYELGMSHVERNTLENIPLSDADPKLSDEMNVMSKLLDCHGSLSIQIHPSDRVCQVLRSANRALQDNKGKEENFYVIRTSDPRIFYLGLNGDRIFETFGCEGTPRQKPALDYILENNEDNIRKFAESLLIGGTDLFLLSLKDVIAGKIGNGLSGDRILELRAEAKMPCTWPVLSGIMFILSLRALHEVLLKDHSLKRDGFNTTLLSYLNNISDLQVGQVVRVEPGIVHAAGPGCYLAEASNQSDNTFRIFDHGREYEPEARPMHYDEAAVAISDESFLDADKQKRHILSPRDESTGGLAPMRIIRQDKLDHDFLFTCGNKEIHGDAPNHGHTVICTEGSVKIFDRTKDEAPRNIMTLPAAHAAYMRSDAGEFHLTSVTHHTSTCVVICSRQTASRPEMTIMIGGTHVKFVLSSYPDPPEERTFLWSEVLKPEEYFSWESRCGVFKEKLTEFLTEVRNESLKEASGDITLLTLSWPGPIFAKESVALPHSTNQQGKKLCIDMTQDPDADMSAPVLSCKGTTLTKLISGCEGINYMHCSIMADAAADLVYELKEFGGKLQKEGSILPGLLLNFSSRVSMAVARKEYPPIHFWVKNRDGESLHISRIGRTFWFDPLTRDWSIQLISPEEEETEEKSKPADTQNQDNNRAIRLCYLLSTTAVVFRFLAEKIGEAFLDECAQSTWQKILVECRSQALAVPVSEHTSMFPVLIENYRPHLNSATKAAFDWISTKVTTEEDVKLFVVEIGRDYGDMLAALYEEFPELREIPTIVLGGAGGIHFGDKGDDKGDSKDKDLFLKTINEELSFHIGPNRVLQDVNVVRSLTSRSSTRLLHAGHWSSLIKDGK